MIKNSLTTIFLALIAILVSCSKDANSPSAINRGVNGELLSSPSVTISGIAPASGVIYTAITISGSNFDLVTSNNVVKINGVTAQVNSATANQLVVTVLPGSSTGSVTVTTGGKSAKAPVAFKVLQMVKVGSLFLGDQTSITSLTSDYNGTPYGTDYNVYGQTKNIQHNVFKIDNGIKLLFQAVGLSSNEISFTNLATDSKNNMYVGENFLSPGSKGVKEVDSTKILKITPAGQVSLFVGGSPVITNSDKSDPMIQMTNIIIDDSDNIYVVGSTNQGEVKKITPNKVVTTVTTINGSASIQQVTKDKLGNIYFVSEITSYTISYYSVKKLASGAITTILNTNTAQITALVTDAANNIYVTSYPQYDNGYDVLNIINQAGVVHVLPTKYGESLSFADNVGNLYTTVDAPGGYYFARYSLQ